MKSWNKNKTIISILLFLIFLFSVVLYFDLKKRKDIGERKIIGIIRYKQKVIQRKFDGDVVWEKIEQDTYITNRDTVRTSSNSILEIELNDKTEIKMDENSMIVLDFSNEKIDIDFAYGTLSAKTDNKNVQDSKLNVKSGDKSIELGNSNAVLSKSNDKSLNLQIEKGNAIIKSKDGDKNVNKNQTATLNENKIEINQESIQLSEPQNQSVLSTTSNQYNVNFVWETKIEGENVLEISKDIEFKNKVKTINAKSSKSTQTILQDSKYFWRVKNLKSKKSSQAYKFTIIKQDKLEFNTPSKNSIITYNNSNPIINFSWNKIENCNSYKLEISKEKEFKNIIYNSDIISNSVGLDNLSEGIYFARLTSKPSSKITISQTSTPISFTVIKNNSLKPIELTTQQGIAASQTAIDSENFILKWKSDPNFVKYEIQISEDSSFNTKQEFETKMNYYAPKNLKKGKFFYRVKGITNDNKESSYNRSDFTIGEVSKLELILPKNNSELIISNEESIEFNWTKSDLLATNVLEISNEESFSNILKKINLNTNKTFIKDFAQGIYFARVKLISNADKNKVIMVSNVSNFKISKILSNLKLVYPIQNEEVDLTNEKNLTLKWESVMNAYLYEIKIYQKTVFGEKIILSDTTNKNFYTINDFKILDEGKFRWNLLAKIKTNTTEYKLPMAEAFFGIKLNSNPKDSPEIISPNKQHIDYKK